MTETISNNKKPRVVKPRAKTLKGVDEIKVDAVPEADVNVQVIAPEASSSAVYRTYEDFSRDELYKYAGLDTYVNYKLLQAIHPETSKPEPMIEVVDGCQKVTQVKSSFNLVHDTYMPIQELILDLEFNGFKYDVEGNRRMIARGDEDCAQMRDSIFSEVGFEFDPDSEKSLAETLYGRLGLPILSRSKGGAPSTDGDAFRALFKASQGAMTWLNTLARYKEVNGAMNTFVRNYVKDFVKPDGRIHPNFNIVGTSSARLTGENPNLTQLPNPRNGYNLRENYIVDEGNVFIAADFSSAEVKLLGALSRDPMLLRCIELDYDFHSFSASLMMGVPYEEFVAIRKDEDHPEHALYNEYRRRSKALTFEKPEASTWKGCRKMNLIQGTPNQL